MKRLVLSFAITVIVTACGGAETDDAFNGGGTAKPGEPRPGKPGASVDAGPASDAGSGGPVNDAGAAPAPDGGRVPDASSPPGDASASSTFDGRWNVTLVANADTSCTNPTSYEAQIVDTWQFRGDTLTGDHLGPNPYTRAAGTDVWNTGETTVGATADLELVNTRELRGVFVFYRDLCDVFYDVSGMRAL